MLRHLKYLPFFAWVLVIAFTYQAYAAQGLPHFLWSYSFLDNGDRFNPYAERYYTSCTYIGPYGEFTVLAIGGKCEWVRLFTEQG